MADVFALHDYQQEAVSEIVEIARQIGACQRQGIPIGKELEFKRVTEVISETGSGKTFIMKDIAIKLSEREGIATITLAPTIDVAEQNRMMGLVSFTTQAFFQAVKAASEKRAQASRLKEAAQKLGLAEGFFSNEVAILVDEAHIGFERESSLYTRVVEFIPRLRILVGFTATPNDGRFHRIDLRGRSDDYRARPLGSLIQSQTLWTLPFQLSLFPSPGLVFTRTIVSSAIVAIAARITHGDKCACLVVGHARGALEQMTLRLFSPVRKRTASDDGSEAHEGGDAYDESPSPQGDAVFALRDFKNVAIYRPMVDGFERRLGLITCLLVLDTIQRRSDARRELQRLTYHLGGLPSLAWSIKLIDLYRPDLSDAFRDALLRRNPAAAVKVASAVSECEINSVSSAKEFIHRGFAWGISVYKIAQGFNYPLLRFVAMAEAIVDSRSFYVQRAGRGARRVEGVKTEFDLVEVNYVDNMADPVDFSRRVSWMKFLVASPARRADLLRRELIFREPLDHLRVDASDE